nr:MAG TPA: hypothetical protein [Caudoviricetes sp.]
MIVCSAESIVLSLSKNRLAKNFTIYYISISCVDGLRPQRPVHHILSCGELCSLLSILAANN